ncbi:MAG: precorrin-6A reductase [Bacillota bacterium]
MILVIGGTSESRAIAGKLAGRGAGVIVSTATGYGAEIAAGEGIEVTSGRLDRDGILKLLNDRGIRVVVDSSHPFACEVSKNSKEACVSAGIPYIRYARKEDVLPESPLIVKVENYREAAIKACEKGKTVFLTTGSNSSGTFIEAALERGSKVIFRVTPDPHVLKKLIEKGVPQKNIIAMQGPFSVELNIALLKCFGADVIVTKESGRAGGFIEKVAAAEKCGIPLIVVKRPPEPGGAVDSIDNAVDIALGLYR